MAPYRPRVRSRPPADTRYTMSVAAPTIRSRPSSASLSSRMPRARPPAREMPPESRVSQQRIRAMSRLPIPRTLYRANSRFRRRIRKEWV